MPRLIRACPSWSSAFATVGLVWVTVLVWITEDGTSGALAAAGYAALLTALVPTALAVRGDRLAPVALAAPTGGRPGCS